ncbi:MAG: methyl-accepting chemotaxis protein, partial [bacterium]
VEQVTQQNTASAEESAASSEELSGQAQELKKMISAFKLKESGFSADIRGQISSGLIGESRRSRHEDEPEQSQDMDVLSPEDEISLDDDDFGKYE